MAQFPIVEGIFTSEAADYRSALPRNLVVVPKGTGISNAYLRNAPGIVQFATGPGNDRGGINWNGRMYRVMGTKLVRIGADATVTVLGDVGAGGTVGMDYGFDRLAIWSGNRLYYYTDVGTFLQVTDPDLGLAIDGCWVAGYFASTDGTNIITTELNDSTAVDPLKYVSAESDSDPLLAVRRLQGQLVGFGRNTIEIYRNVGGSGAPFQVEQGAQIQVGAIGTHAIAEFGGSYAFVGSPRNAPPSVYIMGNGTAETIATREVENILSSYTEAQLADVVLDAQKTLAHQFLFVHLPDRTMVFDLTASKALQQPVWHVRTSGLLETGQYRARGLVYCYDKWLGGDPNDSKVGVFDDNVVTTHYGAETGWQFQTPIAYTGGNSAIVTELQLIGLSGRVALGADPTIATSYSNDGETWSNEVFVSAGKQGDRDKAIAWRRQGLLRTTRMQRFRGNSRLSVSALEVSFEPLAVSR